MFVKLVAKRALVKQVRQQSQNMKDFLGKLQSKKEKNMRKWISLLMTTLVGISTYGNASSAGQLNFEVGYRNDRLEWKHGFPSSSPDVSVKQKFEDIDILQLGVNGRTTLGCNLYLRGEAYFGWVLDGDFKEKASTYQSSNYGFSNERKFIVDDQYVYGINAAIGYPFYFCDCSFAVAPVVGYSIDIQNFSHDGLADGSSGYSNDYFNGFNDCCCKHQFNNRWYGPFVGVDLLYRPYCECWSFWGEVEYHFGTYEGKKGRDDQFNFFDGHKRSNNLRGWAVGLGADYDLSECWTVGLSFKYKDFRATKNSHSSSSNSFFDSGYSSYCAKAKSRHSWNSYSINVATGYQF